MPSGVDDFVDIFSGLFFYVISVTLKFMWAARVGVLFVFVVKIRAVFVTYIPLKPNGTCYN